MMPSDNGPALMARAGNSGKASRLHPRFLLNEQLGVREYPR